MSSIKYIFFDLGDTLIDTSISHKALYFGLKSVLSNKLATEELVLKWEKELYKIFEHYYKKGEFYTVKSLQAMSLKNVLLDYEVDLTDRKLIDAINEFWRYFIKNCQLYEDTLPTLSQLVKDEYKLGLITNADEENVISVLKRYNIIDMFKIRVISSSLKTYKPNIKLFKQAIKLARCSPQEVVYVDDSPIEIYGAKKLGLVTVLINRNKTRYSMGKIVPDFMIDNLQQLSKIIDKTET